VADKELFVLLGPSGCGKTTTLRLIAGLEEPDSGEIYIGNRLVNTASPKQRNVAMVFQSYALYPHMTVSQNMAFPLENMKLPKEEIRRKVRNTAELLGIQDLLDKKPAQISGGQQQRAALGRALVREPDVFLMDEPLSNLDAKLRNYMRMEIKKLKNRIGVTTIYVTHDQVEAMSLAERVGIMNQGNLVQVGSPHEVYSRPSNVFVAGFIGNPPMNLLECDVREDAAFIRGSNEAVARLPEASALQLKKSSAGTCVIGVRPKDVRVYIGGTEHGQVGGRVEAVEQHGDETILDIKLAGQSLKATVSTNLEVEPGDEASVSFPLGSISLFDKSGEVLVQR
jgi:multiple sugar transport system ATP-binding protein